MESNVNFESDKKSKKMRNSESLAKSAAPKEGSMTKTVENVTARVPSLVYLGAAVGSMILSASLAAMPGKKSMANFVGLWAPTILLLGIYNKIVKQDAKTAAMNGAIH